jgi:cellulose synthase/poly-beta-1,6-N-acetylglucosamine synthase-like glycosyltransferase
MTILHLAVLVVVVVMLAHHAIQFTLLGLAVRAMIRRPPRRVGIAHGPAPVLPPVSVILPAFNEAAGIVASVRAILGSRHPDFEVVVVSDGSTDDTVDRLVAAFGLVPCTVPDHGPLDHQRVRTAWRSPLVSGLLVLETDNGGKASALNAGVSAARGTLVACVDADCLLERDGLARATRPFIEAGGDAVIAVGGSVRVANGRLWQAGRLNVTGRGPGLWPLVQTVEYLRAFAVARLGWSEIGAVTLVSGAFGVFRRDAVLWVGGYDRSTIGEDMELVVRLHRRHREAGRPCRIVALADPIAWTEVPHSLDVLRRQRTRWQRGALETLWRHRVMLVDPRYGRPGRIGLAAGVLCDVVVPVAETVGLVAMPLLWMTGALSPAHWLAFLCLGTVTGVAHSMGALVFDELGMRRITRTRDLALLGAAALIENFGFRQLVAWWRVCATAQWLAGRGAGWGAMPRRGLADPLAG